ncbi:MAG: TraB/GumN family protein [Gammaproteobacteria bacterium]
MRTKSATWHFAPLCLLLLFYASSASSGGRYNAREALVEFDCVELVNNGARGGPDNSHLAYSMTLALFNDTLPVIGLAEVEYQESCSTTFDIATNILSDETRIRDDIYAVQLQFDPDNLRFNVLSADFLRVGDTSLWVVSDGVNSVYLGGTIHALHQTDYPLPPAFTEIYNIAHMIVFETDPAIGLSEADSAILELPAGVNLTNLLSHDTIALLESFLDIFGVSFAQFNHYIPEYLEVALLYIGLSGWGFIDGVDFYFSSLAFDDGKLTGGLESNAEHGMALDDSQLNGTNWDARLESLVFDIATGHIPSLVTQDILDWREGRLDNIARDNAADMLADPVGFEALLANRNRNWVPVIEFYLTTPEIEFVLAGLAHFAGPENLLELLETQGYDVTRYVPGSLAGSP